MEGREAARNIGRTENWRVGYFEFRRVSLFARSALRVLAEPTAFGMSRGWYTSYFFPETAFSTSRGAHANDISDHLIGLSSNLILNVAFGMIQGWYTAYYYFLKPCAALALVLARTIFPNIRSNYPQMKRNRRARPKPRPNAKAKNQHHTRTNIKDKRNHRHKGRPKPTPNADQ